MFLKIILLCGLIGFAYIVYCYVPHSPAKIDSQSEKLEVWLNKYRDIDMEGGWNVIKGGNSLRIGMVDTRVKSLKQRLFITGELIAKSELTSDTFDVILEKAVKYFQKNNSLNVTGVVDRITLNELNIPVNKRIKQIEINMNRWNNLNLDETNHYIFVNVASGILDVIEKGESKINMKVIVGKYHRKTPGFNADLTAIEFNPYWVIPPGIMNNDILPKLKNNSSFIDNNNMNVFYNNKYIDPFIINWSDDNIELSNYKIIQNPGPDNPLGVVKFIFPNRHYVYMHDTPSKDLFESFPRTFSSGCIRLSEAVELSKFLLKKDKDWKNGRIDSLINTGKTTRIKLTKPINIYINYLTAWVDKDGLLQFAPDIYKKDIY